MNALLYFFISQWYARMLNLQILFGVRIIIKIVDSKEIEKIQKRATKLVIKLKNKSYIDRLIYLNLKKFLKLPTTYTTEQYHLIFLSTKELTTPEATTINCKIIPFIMTYESIFFSARIVNISNSLPNSVVDACS